MAAVAPPPAPLVLPLPPAGAQAPLPPLPAPLAAPPEVLARLAAGVRLEATVAGLSADGGVLLDTPAGRIVLAIAPAPATGLRFELHIQSLGPRPLAILLNPPHAQATGGGVLPAPGAPAAGVPGQPAVLLAQGALLRAIVLGAPLPGPAAAPIATEAALAATGLGGGALGAGAAQGPGPQPATPFAVAPGTPAANPAVAAPPSIAPAAQAAGGGAVAVPGAPGATAQPILSAATGPLAQGPAGPAAGTARNGAAGSPGAPGGAATPSGSAWPPGAQVPMRILAVIPPSGGPAGALMPPAQASGTAVAGMVTAVSPGGAPIVAFSQGSVVLNGVQPMAVGTAVTAEIAGPIAPPPARGASAETRSSRGAPWQALNEAVAALRDQAASPGRAAPSALPVPRADAQLATQIVSVLGAIRSADIKGWLGDGGLRAIERARPGLGQRVADEFARAAQSGTEPAGEWRVLTLPFLAGQTVEAIRLYLRPRRDDEGDEADAEPGTRFVLDARLTALGRLQLDGLIRRKARQFDLFLRTEQPLPDGQQTDIRALFADALTLTGYRGRLVFQFTPPGFVDPPAALPPLEVDA